MKRRQVDKAPSRPPRETRRFDPTDALGIRIISREEGWGLMEKRMLEIEKDLQGGNEK